MSCAKAILLVSVLVAAAAVLSNSVGPSAPSAASASVPPGTIASVPPATQPAPLLMFTGRVPEIPRRDRNIDYKLDLSKERYFLYVPAGNTGREPYGLIVYTSPGDQMTDLPAGWQPVLEQRKLLFLAAQSVGNSQSTARRCGLAVLGALMAERKFKIDPQRVYAAGLSGGARMACRLGLYQPEVFHGTIQSCGADFYEKVPQAHPVPEEARSRGAYGLLAATREEIDLAKSNVRFVLITGPKDFRHADILNLYEGGFGKSALKTKLLDVPGMGHEDCGPRTLNDALNFIEGVRAAAPGSRG